MFKIIIGIFCVLHGIVHLLYFGQSARYFELKPGLVWPDGSWIFSRFLSPGTARNMASALLILAAIGFIVSGIGLFAKQGWWRTAVIASSVLSSVIYVLFWDGKMQALHDRGFVGVLINLALLALVILWKNSRILN
ncbi:MAG: hypothetical protein JW908_09900 [Anaerolineales bacterium]|nr:hypothetical protein [Anaerolineales bacterium]